MSVQSLDGIDEECIAWLAGHGVPVADGGALRAIQPSRLAHYAFPRTLDRERLRLSTDLIAWLFVFDDAFADGAHRRDPARLAQRHASLAGVLAGQGAQANADAWARSLAELLGRFAVIAPPEWLTRLSHSIAAYFRGCESECGYRSRQRWPTLAEYLGYRDGSIGVYPMLDLIELTTGRYLEPHVLADERLQDAKRFGNLALAITNDIHSSKKESHEEDSFNAVAVIERQYQVERQAALRMTRDLQQVLRLIGERCLAALCERHRSPALESYQAGIAEWGLGNVRWSQECPRYNATSLANDAQEAYSSRG